MSEVQNNLTNTLFKHGTLFDLDVGRWAGIKQMNEDDLLLKEVDKEVVYLGHKKLVPKEAMQRLVRLEGAARAAVNRRSIEFPIPGIRFVPLSALPDLIEELEETRVQFESAVTVFINGYQDMKERQLRKLAEQATSLAFLEVQKLPRDQWDQKAKELNEWVKLQKLKNESFYPPVDKIRQKFRLGWRLFKLSEHSELDALDSERSRLLAAGQKQLQDDMGKWVRDATAALHKTLGESAKNAKELLEKHGKLSPRSLAPLFQAFETFKAMDFTGSSQFRETISKLEDQFSRKEDGSIDYVATADSSSNMKALLETIADLAVDEIADKAGLVAIQKSGEFSRVVEI